MENLYKSEREVEEISLSFVRCNKRTFFEASQEAMNIALRIGATLGENDRQAFRKVVECIATHDAIIEGI